jgi:hypothetical protein
VPLVQYLDDHVAPEQRLFTAIPSTGAIFIDPLAQIELAQRAATKICIGHRHLGAALYMATWRQAEVLPLRLAACCMQHGCSWKTNAVRAVRVHGPALSGAQAGPCKNLDLELDWVAFFVIASLVGWAESNGSQAVVPARHVRDPRYTREANPFRAVASRAGGLSWFNGCRSQGRRSRRAILTIAARRAIE